MHTRVSCETRSPPPTQGTDVKMFAFMSDSPGHVCIRAAILTGFCALLRKCQITSSESVLLTSDFIFYSWGMVISVRRSKTIQFDERELLIPVAALPNNICAVHWVRRHFNQTHVNSSDSAFQVPNGRGVYSPFYLIYLDHLPATFYSSCDSVGRCCPARCIFYIVLLCQIKHVSTKSPYSLVLALHIYMAHIYP